MVETSPAYSIRKARLQEEIQTMEGKDCSRQALGVRSVQLFADSVPHQSLLVHESVLLMPFLLKTSLAEDANILSTSPL